MLFINFIPLNANCNLKVALYGDSLMAGYGLSREFHLSTVLQESLLKKGYDLEVINASVSGDTSTGGLNRLDWLIEDNEIDIIVLCLGANDMLRGTKPSLVRENLNRILEKLTKKNIKIVFAGMLSQDTFGKEYKKEFDNIFPELANKYKVSFLPFLLDGVALDPKYNLSDGKHPNSQGIRLISKNLEKQIIKIIQNMN